MAASTYVFEDGRIAGRISKSPTVKCPLATGMRITLAYLKFPMSVRKRFSQVLPRVSFVSKTFVSQFQRTAM